ncbi:hypothetical protein [Streptomyces sp. NPDC048516]|uniref:hypothetical protein n=1 Tax=Streptomyces sp. NPDC048516 TaxID=3365565 RepID=UPI00371ACB71
MIYEHPQVEGVAGFLSWRCRLCHDAEPAHTERDRERKRRAYARAGIPVCVLIDDFDDRGTVSVLTSPRPDDGVDSDAHCVAYGTEVTLPDGPAKGFTIGEALTGPPRST